MEIEGLTTNEYTFIFNRTILNNNEEKFLLKINFKISFNTTPILKMQFRKNIIND